MTPRLDFAQLELHFVDQMQWRYELIRPLGLFAEGKPRQHILDACAELSRLTRGGI